jgi:hypothetical protein
MSAKGAVGVSDDLDPGTDQYRVGYASERRGGLLQWMGQVFQHLIHGIVGSPAEPVFPVPDSIGQGGDGGLAAVPNGIGGSVKRVLADLAALKQDAAQVKDEVATFRERARESPLQSLWGLLGLLTGLVHRRFAH